jgi:UDPglucose 6-dehydrogenase
MITKKKITIGCVGMTHLGLIHAVAFAEKGFDLICYDDSPQLIAELTAHRMPVSEPQLDELVAQCSTRLQFTNDLHQLKLCDVVFIACDVPTDDAGNSELKVIEQFVAKVNPVLATHASLVILSQVPPGFTRQINRPKNKLFYQVETLIFGRAIERALYPERYIVGADDPQIELPDAYQALLSAFNCPILKMRYESAELAKISINMFLVASVTTTNTIAEICENIGADWEEIAPALRLDRRIGHYAYLSPGLGIAGGNLERDLNTIIKLGNASSTDTGTVSAWLENSQYRRDWVLRCLQTKVFTETKKPVICVLGLAYKPNTHSVKNSPSIALVTQLKEYQIKAHDPIVTDQHITHVTQYADMLDAIYGADIVIVMNPCTEYQNLSIERILKHMRGKTIIDPYRALKAGQDYSLDLNYFSLGQSAIKIENKELEHA